MKKFYIVLPLFSAIMFTGVSTVFAATAEKQTTTIQHNLKPGDAGYVGAANARPSNAFTPSTTVAKSNTIQPNYTDPWYYYEPSSIRVLMRPNNDPSASGTVSTYDFGYYLQNTLPNEWIASWPTEALKAGAISVRTYAWYCVNYPKYGDLKADLDNTINSQVFKPGSAYSSTNSAISATVDLVVTNGSTEMPGFYKAGTYSTARDSSSYNFNNNAYQNGEDYFAANGYNWNYQQMISYYYPGTQIVVGSGNSY